MTSTKPDTRPSAERVAYRDAGEFNKAMDRAADAIRALAARPIIPNCERFRLDETRHFNKQRLAKGCP